MERLKELQFLKTRLSCWLHNVWILSYPGLLLPLWGNKFYYCVGQIDLLLCCLQTRKPCYISQWISSTLLLWYLPNLHIIHAHQTPWCFFFLDINALVRTLPVLLKALYFPQRNNNFPSLKTNGKLLEQYFLNVNVHKNHIEVLLKCRFWGSRFGWGLRLWFQKAPRWHRCCLYRWPHEG